MYSACLLLLGEKDDGTPHAAKETNQAVPNHIGQDPVRFCPGCPVEAKSNFLPVGLNCKSLLYLLGEIIFCYQNGSYSYGFLVSENN